MNIASNIVSFASASAVVDLSKSFIENIISPLTSSGLKVSGAESLKDYRIGMIMIGSFIESLIQFVLVMAVIYFVYYIFI